MNFRSSEILFSRINKFLSGFGNTGEIDENDWYSYVKDVLIRLNVPASSVAETVLDVDNYVAYLPDDFYQLWAAWSGEGNKEENISKRKSHINRYVYYYEDVCLTKAGECKNSSFVPTGELNVIQRDIYLEEDIVKKERYNNVQLLKLVNTSTDLCYKDSFNKYANTENTFTISDKKLKFSFKDGIILLQYFAFRKDEDGLPLIPDDVRIEDAIEAFVIYKELQKMYINGVENVLQRMQYMEMKWMEKYKESKDHLHLPTYKSLIKYAYKNQTKHDKYIIPEIRNNERWWYLPIPHTGTYNFTNFVTR